MIDLGSALYEALWDDPARPPEYTVERWAQELLTKHVREVTEHGTDAHAGLVP